MGFSCRSHTHLTNRCATVFTCTFHRFGSILLLLQCVLRCECRQNASEPTAVLWMNTVKEAFKHTQLRSQIKNCFCICTKTQVKHCYRKTDSQAWASQTSLTQRWTDQSDCEVMAGEDLPFMNLFLNICLSSSFFKLAIKKTVRQHQRPAHSVLHFNDSSTKLAFGKLCSGIM